MCLLQLPLLVVVLFLQLLDDFVHGFLVLSWLDTLRQELESLLHLVLQGLSELGSWSFTEAIHSRSDGALVGKVS